jgi:hypothetical protein
VTGVPEASLLLARRLGARQEALRLGSQIIGTEHLLMASVADPLVRTVLLGFGVDLRGMQAEVTAASDQRGAAEQVRLTGEVVEVLAAVGEECPELARPEPAPSSLVSRGLRVALVALLRDDGDTAAAAILGQLLGERRRGAVAREIERGAPPARFPDAGRRSRPPGPTGART